MTERTQVVVCRVCGRCLGRREYRSGSEPTSAWIERTVCDDCAAVDADMRKIELRIACRLLADAALLPTQRKYVRLHTGRIEAIAALCGSRGHEVRLMLLSIAEQSS